MAGQARTARRSLALAAREGALALCRTAPLIGDELAAYHPDHGHLVAGGVVPPHGHPYGDHDASQGRVEGSASLTCFGALHRGVAAQQRASQAAHDLAADLGRPRAAATEGGAIVFTHGGDRLRARREGDRGIGEGHGAVAGARPGAAPDGGSAWESNPPGTTT